MFGSHRTAPERERDPGAGNPPSLWWEQGCSQLSSPRTAVILVFWAFLSSCCCFVTLTCSLCAMTWGETTCREHEFVSQGLVLSDLVAENNHWFTSYSCIGPEALENVERNNLLSFPSGYVTYSQEWHVLETVRRQLFEFSCRS